MNCTVCHCRNPENEGRIKKEVWNRFRGISKQSIHFTNSNDLQIDPGEENEQFVATIIVEFNEEKH